jgi:hypothetical protein
MKTASDERAARSRARHTWPIRSHDLGSTPGANLRGSTTAAERLAMMWELARQSWSLSGQPFPKYRRSEMPGHMLRPGE